MRRKKSYKCKFVILNNYVKTNKNKNKKKRQRKYIVKTNQINKKKKKITK